MSKVATQIRLDEDLHIKAKLISVVELRSMNAQLEYFILKGIEAYEEQYGKISYTTEVTADGQTQVICPPL